MKKQLKKVLVLGSGALKSARQVSLTIPVRRLSRLCARRVLVPSSLIQTLLQFRQVKVLLTRFISCR